MPAIRLERAAVQRGLTQVLREVSLDVEETESVAVVGAEGSGKSSLLRLVNGLVSPSEGKVEVLGNDLAGLGRAQARKLRARIGYVPQDRGLLVNLTLRDNILLPLRYRALLDPEHEQWVGALCERLRIAPELSRFPADVAAGIQRRAAIARALATRPAILLCDQPFIGVGYEGTQLIQKLIGELPGETRLAVLCTVGSSGEAKRLAKRILRLQNGALMPEETS